MICVTNVVAAQTGGMLKDVAVRRVEEKLCRWWLWGLLHLELGRLHLPLHRHHILRCLAGLQHLWQWLLLLLLVVVVVSLLLRVQGLCGGGGGGGTGAQGVRKLL